MRRGCPDSQFEQSIVSGVSDAYAFPRDLIDVQADLHEAQHDLHALYRTQPSWAERSQLPDAFDLPAAALPLGLTHEQHEWQKKMEARVSELAATVHGHHFWATLSGPNLIHARDALKMVGRED